MSKYSFIVPCYQHSATLDKLLRELTPFGLKIYVVNDGSAAEHTKVITDVCAQYGLVTLIHHSQNQGKGRACCTGMRQALEDGHEYGIQVDSDGQHDLSQIPTLIKASEENPGYLISGRPVYDESVPKARLYGRYVTHVWVWIETLSLDIKDSMCGFRVYPLKPVVDLQEAGKLGARMDFDIEVMVRLYWQGVRMIFIPVRVIYPVGGISHFDAWKDNVRISKMHTRLFFEMLWRFPFILMNKFRRPEDEKAWHRIEELGSDLGISILMLIYKCTGRRVLNLALYPVVLYYSLFGKRAIESSKYFKHQLQTFTNGAKGSFSTFQHIYSFATTAIDKFAVWFGDIKYADLEACDVESLLKIAQSEKGAFFITSHYGNIEVCRALGRFSKVRFNALVYYENAKKFNSFLSKLNPDSNLSLVSVKDFGPALAIALKEKVDAKEWIFMMGDRHSVTENQRNISVSFLGKQAVIPQGPFITAYVMDVPVYVIHCYREGKKFRLRLKSIESGLERGRAHRDAIIKDMAIQYIAELERVVVNDPLQWYNFFNFWSAKA